MPSKAEPTDQRHDLAVLPGASTTLVENYTLIRDLAREVDPPAQGILSRTLHNDVRLKVVVFGIAEGEELSE